MDETTLEILEFPSVLREVASFSMTGAGREKVASARPLRDIRAVEESFREFSEAFDAVKVSGAFPLRGVNDIRQTLSRLDPEGAYLLPPDLLLILSNLIAAAHLRTLNTNAFSRLYPRTSERLSRLSEQEPLREEIERILDEKGEIKDTASTALFRIRKEIRANKERARNILESITTDARTKEYLQEDIISIRDDRYVLAIKAGMHTSFQGVVHGRSGSGATFFIEPIQLVELNNKVTILKREEKAEEIEILKEATRMVAAQREPLLSDHEEMTALDLLQAKALFAIEAAAIVPLTDGSGEVSLKGARHPILVFKEKRGAAPAIPIDVRIPGDKSVLVVSGANTGGKTVALKTLGLLTIMALSAIPIPVDEGSRIVAFDEIFADIGDKQDITASLSTFSAHVKRMKEFLEEAKDGSLVLIDEIGAGTDPSEGSAFALAAIETLRERGAKVAVTTHLNVLKAHAQVTDGYLNASVEFDEKTLRPLYKLQYGVPGPSLGLSIAQSLGIPEGVIERARGYIKEKEGAFIESIRILEEQKEEVRALKERLTELEARKSDALARLRDKRAVLVERARKNLDSMVEKAGSEIRESVERLKLEKKTGPAAAKKAFDSVEDISARLRQRLGKKEAGFVPKPGDKVSVSNAKGVVVTVDSAGKRAEVMVGSLKVWAPWDKLVKRGGDGGRTAQGIAVSADMEVASSLNIIGLRVDEALPLVVKFLDNAVASGLSSVEIVHGVGTGRLAKAVQDHLKDNTAVSSFRQASPSGGGGGVTIVELK